VGVRIARPEDAARVRKINHGCWKGYDVPEKLRKVILGKTAKKYEGMIRDNLKNKSRTMLVAFDKKVLGFAGYWVEGRKGEIKILYVDPSQQRKGTGTRLLKAVVKRTPSVKLWKVETLYNNTKGRSFYKKYGFRVQKTKRAKFMGVKLHEVVMTATRKRLLGELKRYSF